MTKHLIIPDTQCKDGHSTEYLKNIGKYLVEKRPDVVVQIGDFADMASLSSYDKGKKSFEGRRYHNDIEVTHQAMENLLGPLKDYNNEQRRKGKKQYRPRMVLTLGNHENRINRAVENDAVLEGTIGIADLAYEYYGWEVHPFLDVVVIDGIAYSHYFTSGVMGRPIGTANALLTKKHMSCVAGHQQGRQTATAYRADGKQMTAIIAGSAYEHNEDYMGPQGNKHWRGIVMLHEVDDGDCQEMFVSLKFLKDKYGH